MNGVNSIAAEQASTAHLGKKRQSPQTPSRGSERSQSRSGKRGGSLTPRKEVRYMSAGISSSAHRAQTAASFIGRLRASPVAWW